MILTFLTSCLLSVTWALYAYALAFGPGNGVLGFGEYFAFDYKNDSEPVGQPALTVPVHAYL